MRLAVDTHHLLLEHGGTKRVTVNILKEIKQIPDIELIELRPNYLLSIGTGITRKISGHILRFFWVQIHLPILCLIENIDFLLSPEYYTPIYTSCKRAVIVHDAHIRAQKEFINPLWYRYYYIPFIESAIRKADLIFTVSEFSKCQIVELMRLDSRKVHVAYNGIDSCFTKNYKDGIESKQTEQDLPTPHEYILFVGTFEARKNIERLIEAFATFKKRHEVSASKIKLVIVGKPASGKFSDRNTQINNLIETLNLEKEIILYGFVSDLDLPYFYKNACMITFPSLYEGFGLPIIEGFASGVPVLTSNICSMPEIAGSAALLTDPYTVNDISNKIELLMFDLSLRERLILAGYERVKKFTWQNCVGEMLLHIRPLLK